MSIVSTLSFLINVSNEYSQAVHTVVPSIDNIPLPQRIAAFEQEQLFEPAGGYGGLIVESFDYGPLNLYFMGQFDQHMPDNYWSGLGGIYVLGCDDCGEVGCWPLFCQVSPENKIVVWKNFKQPHRPERDYSKFGPFTFDLKQYQDIINELQTQCKVQTR